MVVLILVLILVLGVHNSSLFLIGKPRYWIAQAEHGLAQEDADQKEQGPAFIRQ
jgi:hypothetical protein